MKLLLLAPFALFSALIACTGDCASCHFNIDFKDSRHSVMLNCKVCHTDEKLKDTPMGNFCGQDCFECHDIRKINAMPIQEHLALNTCISCHKKIDKKLNPNINPLFNNKAFNRNLNPLK